MVPGCEYRDSVCQPGTKQGSVSGGYLLLVLGHEQPAQTILEVIPLWTGNPFGNPITVRTSKEKCTHTLKCRCYLRRWSHNCGLRLSPPDLRADGSGMQLPTLAF